MWWGADGVVDQKYTWTIPDGYYSIGTLNELLVSFLVKNNLYMTSLVDGVLHNVYFIQLRLNTTSYAVEIVYLSLNSTNTYNVIDSSWSPSAAYQIPQMIIPTTSKFGQLIGMNFGSQIPPQTPSVTDTSPELFSKASDFTPEMEPSTSFIVTTNLCKNNSAKPSNLLDSFTLTSSASFGQMMSPLANENLWAKCPPGQYQSLTISIQDQAGRPLQIRDPNVLMILAIDDPSHL
jgi:hypothetical protein